MAAAPRRLEDREGEKEALAVAHEAMELTRTHIAECVLKREETKRGIDEINRKFDRLYSTATRWVFAIILVVVSAAVGNFFQTAQHTQAATQQISDDAAAREKRLVNLLERLAAEPSPEPPKAPLTTPAY